MLTLYRTALVIVLTFIATILHDFARDARNELAAIREKQSATAAHFEDLQRRVTALEVPNNRGR